MLERISSPSPELTQPTFTGEFIHVVGVLDFGGSVANLYVNGNLATSQGFGPTIDDWSDGTEGIGVGQLLGSAAVSTPGANDFQGELSVFRIYDSALTDTQVANNFDSQFLSVSGHDAVSNLGIAVTVDPDGHITYDPGTTFDHLNPTEAVHDGVAE